MNRQIMIAHRGNLDGPNSKLENRQDYINTAISLGYNVEVDVWFEYNQFWLGHDRPQYKTTIEYLQDNGAHLWVHAKNFEAFAKLTRSYRESVNAFYHDIDAYALTTWGWVWAYPGKPGDRGTIAILPEIIKIKPDLTEFGGVCSDYIRQYDLTGKLP